MESLLQKSLFSIIEQSPASIMVLEKFHVDYCHFSKKTLAEICQMQQIPTFALIKALEEILKAPTQQTNEHELNALSLSELIAFILQNYHAYLKNQLPAILSQLEKITKKHDGNFPFLLDVYFFFELWKDEITAHLIYEESKLFPAIIALEKNAYKAEQESVNTAAYDQILHILEKEHEHSDDLIEKIKTLTNNFTAPPQSCKTLQLNFALLKQLYQNLQEHLYIENNVLLPKAKKLMLHMPNYN